MHSNTDVSVLFGAARRKSAIGSPDRLPSGAPVAAASQINIDLIAGMLGETEENWRACIDRTLALEPDSVTIYQMELPSTPRLAGIC